VPKIISESCELVKLCHINCRGPFFLRHSTFFDSWEYWTGADSTAESASAKSTKWDPGALFPTDHSAWCESIL